MKRIIFLSLGIILSLNVNANDETSSNESVYERSGWFFSGGQMNFDSAVAEQQGIKDSSFYLNLGYEGHKGALAYGFGMSGLILSDDNSFTQRVVDNFGNTSTASSSADAFGFYGELGYSMDFESGGKSFDILAGLEAINASRGISNCSNCFSEDIDLSSGLYIKPRFRFYAESGFVFSFDYHQYLSGDIENGFSLNFSWTN
ncbi:porin family protein [Aliikangiella marina]|uniref:Porin family protein n=1 Tax=Aliikangiella marina TaxID=1712262 RepID=A0A545TBX9_9GAMM|nr:porin family protein [Aliikangiella marina]TQV74732.1 porin family protein [Aliikangiella marina]